MTERRERRRRDTKESLMRAGSLLFSERGVLATRIEDITNHADVGKGVFYNHFDSKDALIAALIEEAAEQLRVEFLPSEIPTAVGDRVSALVGAHERLFARHPHYALLLQQARGLLEMTPNAAPLRAAFSAYLRLLSEFVVPHRAGDRDAASVGQEWAAVIAGAVAGYRSFRIAQDARVDFTLLASILSTGLSHAQARD